MDRNKCISKYVISLMLFGSNGIVASGILMPSYDIVLLRTFIGSIFIFATLILCKTGLSSFKNKKELFYAAISGCALGAGWIFLYTAYTKIGVSVSTVLYYCGPVIVIALSPILFKEKLTKSKITGIFIVLLGMIMLNFSDIIESGISTGFLFGIIAAVFYAIMVVFSKKSPSITGLESSAIQLLSSFAVSAVFAAFKGGIAINGVFENLFPILVLGIINTGVGCFLYFSSMRDIPAQSVSVLGYIEPLSAIIYSSIILKEKLSFVQLLGAVMIICGVAAGELLSSRKIRAWICFTRRRFRITIKHVFR